MEKRGINPNKSKKKISEVQNFTVPNVITGLKSTGKRYGTYRSVRTDM